MMVKPSLKIVERNKCQNLGSLYKL